jgi:hypothetical protein
MLADMPDDNEVPQPVREGRDLLDYFYGFSREDDPDRYSMQNEFRQDVYRLIVIQFHLAIEDLVRSFVFERVTSLPDPGTFTYEKNVEFVNNLNSRQLLELAARLHVLTKLGYDELTKLNAIRNKCSHHWMLHSFSTKEMIKANDEAGDVDPRIEFNGKNLLTPQAVKDEFLPLYGDIYVELWGGHHGIDHEHVYTDETLETIHQL